MNHESKNRILYMLKLLAERSDENHPLSTAEIIQTMENDYSIQVYRTTVNNDMELLKQFGYDVVTIRSSQNQYYLASRLFEEPELKLLIDAVNSSKFITGGKSRELVEKLLTLTNNQRAENLKRCLYVEEKKQSNERIYYIIDAINEAMMLGKKIAFQSYHYTPEKKKIVRHEGDEYIVSPYRLVCSGEQYYLVGFCDNYNELRSFRVDKIVKRPIVLEDGIVTLEKETKIEKHIGKMFRMFDGETKHVTLICDNDVMDTVIDHFGEDVKARPVTKTHFSVRVETAVSPIFFRWVFGFGGKIRISSPETVRDEYKKMIDNAIKSFEDEK